MSTYCVILIILLLETKWDRYLNEFSDINSSIYTGKGVSELVFMMIKPGDKYCKELSEGGADLIPILQKMLWS